jgi:hypothetical protein
MFDWGDGSTSAWTSPVNSGQPGSASHSWSQGSYQIKVKARDTQGAESIFSDQLSISMPKTKPVFHPILMQLLDRLLEQFPLLANLLEMFTI